MSRGAPRLTDSDVQRLRALRGAFGADAATQKRSMLASLSTRSLVRPRMIRAYHDVLLFIAAYPDDALVERLVNAELRRISRAVASLPGQARALLTGSGIAGSTVQTGFSIELLSQLVKRHRDAIEIAWNADGSAGEAIDEALAWCVDAIESVGLLSQEITTEKWVELSGMQRSTAINWIVQRLKSHCTSPALREQIFEHLDLPLRWSLASDGASRTLTRLPIWSPAYQTSPIRRSIQFLTLIREPLRAPAPLPVKDARRMIGAAQDALAVRGRETDPLTAANELEVYHLPAGHGFDVNLFGIKSAYRLPLESYIGYVAARHGVPVAYGGAWIFYDRAEIGINVFDEFRGGESALLFTQIMRVYHRCCGVRLFVVEPFQFGAENEEGLRSGAFWFYYRMGFRPSDVELRAMARREWRRIAADRRYRSPIQTLRRLATGSLVFMLPGARRRAIPDQVRLGLAVTANIAERFGGSREAAQHHAVKRVLGLLGAGTLRKLSRPEREWFNRLSVAIDVIDDLESWPVSDRRKLRTALQSRGGEREMAYQHALQRCDRLRRAWRHVDIRMKSRLRGLQDQ